MRVVGNKEGYGKGSKGNGDGNRGVRRGTVTATKRAMALARRVVDNEEGNGNVESNGNSYKGTPLQTGQ
jgi:hypothetical protein